MIKSWVCIYYYCSSIARHNYITTNNTKTPHLLHPISELISLYHYCRLQCITHHHLTISSSFFIFCFSCYYKLIFLILNYIQKWTHILADNHRVTTAKDFNSRYQDSSNEEDTRKPWTALIQGLLH